MTTWQELKMLARWAVASKLLSWTCALVEKEMSETGAKALLVIANEFATFEMNNREPATEIKTNIAVGNGFPNFHAIGERGDQFVQQYGRFDRAGAFSGDVPRYQQVNPSRYLPTTITVDGVTMTPDEYLVKYPNGHGND